MRRRDLRDRSARVLAATILIIAGGVVPVLAGTSNVADDRPPLLAVEPAPEGVQPASHLVDFSVVDGADNTVELVLRGDGGMGYQVFKLVTPDRLVLDLPGVKTAVDRNRAEVGDDGLVRVRVGQYRVTPQPVARVVLEFTRVIDYQIQRDSDSIRVRMPRGAKSTALAGRRTEAIPVPASASAAPAQAVPQVAAAKAEPASNVAAAAKPVAVPTAEPVVQAASVTAPAVNRPAPATASNVVKPAVTSRPELAAPIPSVDSGSPLATTPAATPAQVPAPSRQAPVPASNVTKPAEPKPAPVPEKPRAAVAPTAEPKAPQQASLTSSDTANGATSAVKSAAAVAPSDAADRSAFAARPARPLAPEGAMLAPAVASPANTPTPAAEKAAGGPVALPDVGTKMIQDQRRTYSGKAISLNLVEADIRQVFGVFHELSGLNFVLDPGVTGTITIVVDEVPWDQALDLILQNNGLEMVLEGNVIRIAPIAKLAREAGDRKLLREAKELEANPVTITRTLSYAQAKEIERVVREAILSPKGRVIVDARTNTLIIRDIPDRIEAIDKLLTTLDAETPQVMIEARIVEVSRSFTRDLGIRWGSKFYADPSKGTETNLQFPHRADLGWSLNLPKNPAASALSMSFGNVLDSFTLDITLDALETQGYAKRLSSPKVATQNNAAAEIEQGVRFPIVNTTATEIKTEFVSASLRLKCTPQITAEGTVILEIEVSNDQPDFVQRNAGTVPAVNTQRAMTKVLIADGGTTVIGGIYTVNEGTSTMGVPWFNKLPGFGWLFRNKSVTNENRELLIFITPRIVKAS